MKSILLDNCLMNSSYDLDISKVGSLNLYKMIKKNSYLYFTSALNPCKIDLNSARFVGVNHWKSEALIPPPQEAFSLQVPEHACPDFLHSFNSSMSGISKSELSAAKLLKASRIGRYPVHL